LLDHGSKSTLKNELSDKETDNVQVQRLSQFNSTLIPLLSLSFQVFVVKLGKHVSSLNARCMLLPSHSFVFICPTNR
jgi:hypothetical protein